MTPSVAPIAPLLARLSDRKSSKQPPPLGPSRPGARGVAAPGRKRGLRLGTAVALASSLAACRHPAPVPSANLLPARAIHVAAAAVSARSAGEEVIGTVRARRSATLAATMTGTVGAVLVHLGSRVRSGDVVVRLSAHEVDAKLDQARALYAHAKLENDCALALADAKAIPTAQVDAARSQLDVAQGTQAEASALAAHTELRAPFDGVVTAKSVNVGDTAVPGQALLVIEQPEHLRFEASVPEANSLALTSGRRFEVRIDTIAQVISGVVAEIGPTADPASRTFTIKLDLPPTAGLHAGQFGRMTMPTTEAHALVVPSTALVRHGQLEEVFIVERERAWLRLVKIGRDHDGLVELQSGVDAGELVATSDVAQLIDGQPVRSIR